MENDDKRTRTCFVPMQSTSCNVQKPFTVPMISTSCNQQIPFMVPMQSTSYNEQGPICRGCNDESNCVNAQTTFSANEILTRFDRCDVNENEIPGLFQYMEMHLPGYRFVPTDDKLITHYLRKKIAKEHIPRCLIRDVDLYHHHPKDLAERYPKLDSQVQEWYFYTPRDRKYPNGSRPKRAAGNGYWKATGKDMPVKVKDETVGFRQALVFYEGKPSKGEKTNWIMHEFKVFEKRQRNSKADMRLDDWVLCRLYYKKGNKALPKEEDNDNDVEEDTMEYDADDYLVENPECMFTPENIPLSPNFILNNGKVDDGPNLD